MKVNIGKAMPTAEISLKNVGDTVHFHDGRIGKIVSMLQNTFNDHPFTISINGNLRQYDHFGYPLLDSDPIVVKVISGFNKKKIIQISTAMTTEAITPTPCHAVTALCDDGSVYVSYNNGVWSKLPDIME